jgi:hypothetical protein
VLISASRFNNKINSQSTIFTVSFRAPTKLIWHYFRFFFLEKIMLDPIFQPGVPTVLIIFMFIIGIRFPC